jgi:N6-L-threonylcarbamoyladenine synthase
MSLILGLETSCDETAAAVVADGRSILSNVVASQIELHRRYGGVFPEIASRQHVLDIIPVIEEALAQAGTAWAGLDAIAVTCGPGLVGSLLVGVNVAKGIAWAKGLPLIGVNHLEAHLYANWLYTLRTGVDGESPPPAPRFPLLCLIVSGGHSDLVLMTAHGQYRVLGRTVDDAAGEAFDKVARLLDLGYPGGPAIQKAAEGGIPNRFDFPRAMLKQGYDFSFSGVKTAVLRTVQKYQVPPSVPRGEGLGKKPSKERSRQIPSGTPPTHGRLPIPDLAASFQAAVVDVLVEKTRRATEEFQVEEVLLAGGVASNALLRGQMVARVKVPVRYPPPILCTDNAAMVASAGYFKHMAGERAGWDLDVQPGMCLRCEPRAV